MVSLVSQFHWIAQGGYMMYPLLVSGLIAFTIILERFFTLKHRYKTSLKTYQALSQALKEKNWHHALRICQNQRTPVTSVLQSGIKNFHQSLEKMELSMKNQADTWLTPLEQHLSTLDTIITAAPLMGLLGTITGMMSTFHVLSDSGIHEPQAITGGIAEALIATATGLVIALISLIAYNYLSNQVKHTLHEAEALASELIDIKLHETELVPPLNV